MKQKPSLEQNITCCYSSQSIYYLKTCLCWWCIKTFMWSVVFCFWC